MTIKKQEFYEGAALHLLVRSGQVSNLQYTAPLFIVNGSLPVLLKYCTRARSPWGFTFMPAEDEVLRDHPQSAKAIIGLICGSDGIAAVSYDKLSVIADARRAPVHIACYRAHNQHYEISGPNGVLVRKVPPSLWQRILEG